MIGVLNVREADSSSLLRFAARMRRALALATLLNVAMLLHSSAAFSVPGFLVPSLRHAHRSDICGHGWPAGVGRLARGGGGGSARRQAVSTVGLFMLASSGKDWESVVDRVIDDLNKGMAKYIFVRSVDAETAAELRAAVLVAGRGYKRRSAPAEGAPAPTLQDVVTAVHGAVKVAIVENEELIAEEDWDKIAVGFGQASAIVNADGDQRPANAPPLTLDEVVVQLERMFPNASPGELEEAARRGLTLEAATDLIMTSAVSLTRMSEKPYVAPRGTRKVAPVAVPAGGAGCLTTQRINGGASAFGLYLDISAKEHPIRVTALRAASSAGLNLGDGKDIAVTVNLCKSGSGRGRETDMSAWQLAGSRKDVRLPVASWFDENVEYSPLPLDEPFDIAAGQTVGVCIHSSDVNGLAIRMARNQAGIDSDMTDDDFGGTEDDEVGGSLRNSYYVGAVSDDDPFIELRCGFTACSPSLHQPPVSQPVPAAFVGAIDYVRTA